MADTPPLVLTVGHSVRPIEVFVALLVQHGCEAVVDVRSLPHSRHNPQFNRDALAASLAGAGIAYRHCAPLGGLRRPLPEDGSPNRGLRDGRFRAYADHMQTDEFGDALERLIALASIRQCAVMCAEALSGDCHRSLLADALAARGCLVRHIVEEGRVEGHRLREEALVSDGRVSYPGGAGQQHRLDRWL